MELALMIAGTLLFVFGWAFGLAGFMTLCHAAGEQPKRKKEQRDFALDAYLGLGLLWINAVFQRGWKRSPLGRRLFLTGCACGLGTLLLFGAAFFFG